MLLLNILFICRMSLLAAGSWPMATDEPCATERTPSIRSHSVLSLAEHSKSSGIFHLTSINILAGNEQDQEVRVCRRNQIHIRLSRISSAAREASIVDAEEPRGIELSIDVDCRIEESLDPAKGRTIRPGCWSRDPAIFGAYFSCIQGCQ